MKYLNFLRITDESGRISLTNLAMLLCLGKLAFAPAVGIPEIGALFLSLASYQWKRYHTDTTANDPEPEANTVQQALDESAATVANLTREIGTVKAAMGIKSAFGTNK